MRPGSLALDVRNLSDNERQQCGSAFQCMALGENGKALELFSNHIKVLQLKKLECERAQVLDKALLETINWQIQKISGHINRLRDSLLGNKTKSQLLAVSENEDVLKNALRPFSSEVQQTLRKMATHPLTTKSFKSIVGMDGPKEELGEIHI